ncbi:small integral membrane protein 1 [Myotis myotis]|uniref:Small integral membrane protein 1 (Vel blood group) n=1 Tax=Myotis myotis TaxID=51298 RepID=A0A7J8A292_MYOMY|nr:small integral membrane protein 1 [Myotis myotis]XP_036203811.1 small integral membrane protein 1 [Myotis myotis]XP_036203812.1 small integral membrane protein 1 [Myotis myotis]KAF6380399.1 small integral membrane protein 1 (Vel blood group) [Myotis myotis]
MEPQDPSVQYSRWDEVRVGAASSPEEAPCCERLSRKLCSGRLGVTMRMLGGVALFWVIFILGYVAGYLVHKCK